MLHSLPWGLPLHAGARPDPCSCDSDSLALAALLQPENRQGACLEMALPTPHPSTDLSLHSPCLPLHHISMAPSLHALSLHFPFTRWDLRPQTGAGFQSLRHETSVHTEVGRPGPNILTEGQEWA